MAKTANKVGTKGGSTKPSRSTKAVRASRRAATVSTTLPDDVRRNSYTADREPGLHVRGLRTS